MKSSVPILWEAFFVDDELRWCSTYMLCALCQTKLQHKVNENNNDNSKSNKTTTTDAYLGSNKSTVLHGVAHSTVWNSLMY